MTNYCGIEVDSVALFDKTIVITGTFKKFTCEQVQKLVELADGEVTGSVRKNTDLLIAGDKAGSKLAKAEELDVEVINEEKFIELIDNNNFEFDPEESMWHSQISDYEWAEIDQNHQGELWITQECRDAFYWEEIHQELEFEKDEDGNYYEEDQEYVEKGFKYKVFVNQIASVVNHRGIEIRGGYKDEDVYVLNDLTQEMLDHPGCKIMGWCNG